MFYAKDGSFLVDAETLGRPDQDTAGPILVQGFLQYLCQGVIIAQAAKFYERWEDDPVALRAYVIILVIFSLLQTVLESYKTWVVTVLELHWWTSKLHFTEFLCNAIICSLCEVFLIRRCFRMTGMKILVLAYLASLTVVTFSASIILTAKIAMVVGPIADRGPAHIDPLRASVFAYPLWVYGTLLTALSITTILSCSLWRTRTGLNYLDRTLTHIIAITWETAALPAVCMLASAIIFSIRDANGIDGPSAFAEANLDLFFAILTGKVYTLGLLRTLNKRTQFRARLHSGDLGRQSLSEWEWAAAGGAEGRPQAETSTDSACKTVAEAVSPKVTFDGLKDEGVVRSVGADSGSPDVDAGHSEKPGGEVESTTTSAESAMEEGVSGGLPVASDLGSSTGTLV
ncbi:hypothetical protein K466DRAFT_51941 [Polyporus arcularius HHB13444]|uniref:DUF6534 domain-containing protein n=1 Tax=Polyporus arcularius HHB13444 TaxID=1314778 RepID=A0A5C3PI28_9APHY|nr:hypothetical protein K466DRAFT_51941 [Polyporus arcularius HHB13444]